MEAEEGPRAEAKGKGQKEGLQVTARRAAPVAGPPLSPISGGACTPASHGCPTCAQNKDQVKRLHCVRHLRRRDGVSLGSKPPNDTRKAPGKQPPRWGPTSPGGGPSSN